MDIDVNVARAHKDYCILAFSKNDFNH